MILVFGYLGFNNFGDELLAQAVEEKLRAQDAQEDYEEILRLSRKKSIAEHIGYLISARKLVAIGGIFQDQTSSLSLFYYTTVIMLAKLFGTEIVLDGVGIGPLNGFISRIMTLLVFRLADRISVRDLASSKMLNDLGVEHNLVRDLSWGLLEDEAGRLLRFARNDGGRDGGDESKNNLKTCFCLRPSDYSRVKLIEFIKSYQGEDIEFLIMQSSDRAFVEKLLKELKLEADIIDANDYQLFDLLEYMSTNYHTMISMRLHALVLAHSIDLKLEAICVDPKIEEFMKEINQDSLTESPSL